MKPMRIYAAGRIPYERGTWRRGLQDLHDVDPPGQPYRTVSELREQYVKEGIDRDITPAWTYVGPYTWGCDHGCAHAGESPHGLNAGTEDNLAGCLSEDGLSRQQVLKACRQAIDKADVVVALIDSPECYGTFAEVGYAYGKGKRIYLRFDGLTDKQIKDMWFLREMALSSGATLRECHSLPFPGFS